MPNEVIVKDEINALFSPNDIEMLTKFEELEARVKVMKEQKNKALLEIFKKYGIDSFKNESVSIKYVAPSIRTVVDTKRMKEEGIYDLYTKETPVKESIRITLNYEED